jgi:hypothetical protein
MAHRERHDDMTARFQLRADVEQIALGAARHEIAVIGDQHPHRALADVEVTPSALRREL